MKIDPNNNCPYASGQAPFGDVVLSSRARFARNLEGFPFVNRATASDCEEVETLVAPACSSETAAERLESIPFRDFCETDRAMCVERHLISEQFASSTHPHTLLVGPELSRSVMVNEEDHLRIQCIQPGLQLQEAHHAVSELDHRLEDCVAYAFHDELGFLTACPSNLGTGARFSVLLHLPGLKITKGFAQLHNACVGMSIAIRGYHGEGSNTIADLYQLSNQVTLGYSEDDLRILLEEKFLPIVIESERNARTRIIKEFSSKLDDRVFRAQGILENARLLSVEESMDCLGRIRLGVSLERIRDIEINTVNQLFIEIQKGHLQRRFGTDLSDSQLQEQRAILVQEKLTA
ncbi:MAG: ATP--guanido phosphotransferase [Phycisphaerales bacterium]|jgi:protein arginine kinase|nr:ATP--guanido phosphotransferase [Phycisphaerales bacterium]